MQSLTEKNHIDWIDYLRITACFLVVLAHCCDPFVGRFDNNPAEFLSGVSWGSLVRCCVPLFVMISGVLLLPVKTDMGTFYSKRMKRILIPLIFWSLLLPLLNYAYYHLRMPAGGDITQYAGVLTQNPNIDLTQYTWDATWMKMYTFIFNFNYDTTPLWYLYMLVGIYLFLPIISAWTSQARQKDLKIFLGLWIVSMILPYLQLLAPLAGYQGNGGDMSLWGICAWNPFGTLYYFSGFLGYVVLAHYLARYPLNWSWGKTTIISSLLFVAGYAITFSVYLYMYAKYSDNYAKLEIPWYFFGISVFMMTFAVYSLFCKIKATPSPLIRKIAALTFGVYLSHFIIVQMCYDAIYPVANMPAWLLIPILTVASFAVTLIWMWLMSLVKWLRWTIM